jgi:hypothetical protein
VAWGSWSPSECSPITTARPETGAPMSRSGRTGTPARRAGESEERERASPGTSRGAELGDATRAHRTKAPDARSARPSRRPTPTASCGSGTTASAVGAAAASSNRRPSRSPGPPRTTKRSSASSLGRPRSVTPRARRRRVRSRGDTTERGPPRQWPSPEDDQLVVGGESPLSSFEGARAGRHLIVSLPRCASRRPAGQPGPHDAA